MKVTVITTTYNAEENIADSLNSVINQTYTDWEYLVIDGKSSDNTIQILDEYAKKDKRIKFISEKDDGVYNAMNKGISLATGKYIIFLGAGDCLESRNILKDVQTNLEINEPDILYGYVYWISNKNKIKYKHKINYMYTLRFRPVSHQAVFAKTSLLKEDMFNENYKITADQDWMLRQYKRKKKIIYINRPIALYDVNGISSARNSQIQAAMELEKILTTYFPKRIFAYHIIKKMGRFGGINIAGYKK